MLKGIDRDIPVEQVYNTALFRDGKGVPETDVEYNKLLGEVITYTGT
jgi:hypothetical protein